MYKKISFNAQETKHINLRMGGGARLPLNRISLLQTKVCCKDLARRHGKSSNPSANALLEHYKFPQIRGHKFQQKGLICNTLTHF